MFVSDGGAGVAFGSAGGATRRTASRCIWQHARAMEDESRDKETQEVENEAEKNVENNLGKGKEVQSEEPKAQGRSLMQIVTLLDQMAEDVCKLVVDKDADEAIESLESKLEVIDFACEKAEKEALDEESYLLLSQLAKILQYLNGQLVQDRDEHISRYVLVRAGNGLEVRTFDPNAQRDAFPQRQEFLRQAMQGGGSYVYPAHSAMAYQPYNVQQTHTQLPTQYQGYFPGTHAIHYVSEGGIHSHESHLPTPSYTAPTHIDMNAQMLLGQTRGRMQYGMMQHTPYGYQPEPQLQLGLPAYSQGQQFQNPQQMHGFPLTGYPQNFVPQWNQSVSSSMQQPQPQVIPMIDQRKGPGHQMYSPYLQK